jgi:hypothetical protein
VRQSEGADAKRAIASKYFDGRELRSSFSLPSFPSQLNGNAGFPFVRWRSIACWAAPPAFSELE